MPIAFIDNEFGSTTDRVIQKIIERLLEIPEKFKS